MNKAVQRNKELIEKLDEFRYSLGDTRFHLLDYILSLNKEKTQTYLKNYNKELPKGSIITYKCVKNEKGKRVRDLVPPMLRYDRPLVKTLKEGPPIVIIPMMIKTKGQCQEKTKEGGIKKNLNRSKHIFFMLYNKITHEVEKIDIKLYHIKNFTIKLLNKRLKDTFHDEYFGNIDPKCKFINELDPPIDMVNKLDSPSGAQIYPMFIIAYLRLRLKFIHDNSEEILERVERLSRKNIEALWNEYVEFAQKKHEKYDQACLKDKNSTQILRNPESGFCVNPKSKNLTDNLLETKLKRCAKQKVYDAVVKKCVDKSELIDINIMLDNILDIKLDKNHKFTHLGQTGTILTSVSFVCAKYKYAYIMFPTKYMKIKDMERKDIAIRWAPKSPKSKEFELTLPKYFHQMWADGINNPEIRFIITMISMTPITHKSGHANMLIYDKTIKELIIFDPLGIQTLETYATDDMYVEIKEIFKKIDPDIKVLDPNYFCPRFMYQWFEMDQPIGLDEPGQQCSVWRLFYLDTRLANPHLTNAQVTRYSIAKIKDYGSFPKFIKSYQIFITRHMKSIEELQKEKENK